MIKLSYTSWSKDIVEFNFDDLEKGLDWLSKDECPTCTKIKEPWYDVLKCTKVRKIQSCLLCEDFVICQRTSYQRDRYLFVLEYYQEVKELGLEKLEEEEHKKVKRVVTLIDIRQC